MYVEGLLTEELTTLFQTGTAECKPNNLQFSDTLKFNEPPTGILIGEACSFLIDKNEDDLQMLVLKKCAQLEADIIRVQCQTSEVPHPLELLDSNIWACVAVGTHESIHSMFLLVFVFLT